MVEKENFTVVPFALSCALKEGLEQFKFLYILAQTGWGKTTSVRQYFHARNYTYVSLWDDDALEKAERDSSGLVVLDDCHVLADKPDQQKRLTDLLRNTPKNGNAVLISRAPLPDYLLPFRLAGMLTIITNTAFQLGFEDVSRLSSAMGVELSHEDTVRLLRESQGYPLSARLLCAKLAEGSALTKETVRGCYAQMFDYLDKQLFSYWGSKVRRLLMSISFFASFTVELARIVTGDNQVEQTLIHLCKISSFLDTNGKTYAIRYSPFRAYLQRKAEITWSAEERSALYSNAGMYFQLNGDLPAALDCYVKNGNHAKVSEILTEHARLNPGQGIYYQLRNYYWNLPEKEILASPELMSAMSVLCSLTFDVEGSEKWYGTLAAYAQSLSRRDHDYREVWGLVCYLDVALPHRGSMNIKDILLLAANQLKTGSIRIPEFSVTSNMPSLLRGGKDFSSWVPKDRLLYNTIRKPVEMLLGRFGVGLGDIALAESRYEKGEDITGAYLTLSARRVDIQQRGMPEMEFVFIALTAKCQCDKGEFEQAVSDVQAFRRRMVENGKGQLLPNIDALLCRFDLLKNGEYVHKWFVEQAPDENDFFVMERYRYLTKARCYIKRKEYMTALALLGLLLDYFTRYDRALDRIEALILLAICRWRMEAGDWREHLDAALKLAQEYGYVTVFAHEGAALLPLLREMEGDVPKAIRRRTQAYAARYPDYLAPAGSVSIQKLTKKELEVLRLICLGKRGEEIRGILDISENTLKTHSRNMFKKLGVNSRAEARAIADRLHLV